MTAPANNCRPIPDSPAEAGIDAVCKQWGDLQHSGDGVAAPTKNKRAKSPVSRGRRLLGKQDILDAVEWRLSGWTPAAIESGKALVAQLIEQGIPLDDARPEVVEAMASFPRGRRELW